MQKQGTFYQKFNFVSQVLSGVSYELHILISTVGVVKNDAEVCNTM